MARIFFSINVLPTLVVFNIFKTVLLLCFIFEIQWCKPQLLINVFWLPAREERTGYPSPFCIIFSSLCQRQCELLPSLGVRRPSSVVCRPLSFHILIFLSETPQPYDLKLGRSIYGKSSIKVAHFVPIH